MQRKIPWDRIDSQRDFRLTDRDFLASEDLLDEQQEAFDSDPAFTNWVSKYAPVIMGVLVDEMTLDASSATKNRKRRIESSIRLIIADVRRLCEAPNDKPETAAAIGENLRKLRTALDKARAAIAKMGLPTRRYLAEALYEGRNDGTLEFPVSVLTDPIVLVQRYADDTEHLYSEIDEVLERFNVHRMKNIDQCIIDMFKSTAIIWYRTTGAWPKTHKDDFSIGSDTSAPVSRLYELLQDMVKFERPDLLRVFGPKNPKIKLGDDPSKPSLGRKTFQVAVTKVRDDAAKRYADFEKRRDTLSHRRLPVRRIYYEDLRFGI